MAPDPPNELERRFLLTLKEHGMSFEEAGAIARRVILSKARSMPPQQVDDCMQNVWLGVLRYVRDGVKIDNLEALLVTIAKRQAYRDYSNRSGKEQPIDPEMGSEPGYDPGSTNEARWRLFMIREFLRSASPRCLEVLDLVHEGYDHSEIADQLGKGHAAMRKAWSRCVALIRDAFGADSSASAAWARLFS
jgi:RNA polymerase sigma factor (sigma-70 family)